MTKHLKIVSQISHEICDNAMSWKRQWLIKISGDQYSIGRIGNTLFLSGRYVKSAPGATSPNTASRLPLARETRAGGRPPWTDGDWLAVSNRTRDRRVTIFRPFLEVINNNNYNSLDLM